MKKILYTIAAGLLLFACNAPVEQNPSQDPVDATTFDIAEVEPLSAEAQEFNVEVKTSIDFDVVIPEDATWLTLKGTKAVETKIVTFAVTLNEEDQMRQTKVTFKGKDGVTSKTLAIMQKAGGGIEIEAVSLPDSFPVEGGTFEVEISSNVPFSASSEADWLMVTAAEASVTLEIAPNAEPSAREAEVQFFREGTDKLIYTMTVKQNEPHVILNDAGYADLASALEAYSSATEASTLILDAAVHTGDIVVGPDNAPLTIEGNGVATLDGTIEVKGKVVTIDGLTIAPSQAGSLPVFDTGYKYEHGIMLHDAGLGSTISNVTIDMSKLAADATGIFLLSEASGYGHDIIRSTTIDGGDGGHRLIQAYGAKASITSSTFKSPYSSYAVRIGNENCDVTVANNEFIGTAGCGVHFNNLSNSTITLGNGVKDNNKFEDGYAAAYKANNNVNDNNNTFYPNVSYGEGGVLTIVVDPNAMESLSRVWGYYDGNSGAWSKAISTCSNWYRNGVISGDYIYLTIAGNEEGKYGVAVFNRSNGQYVRTITQGFQMEGRFWTSGIARMAEYDDEGQYLGDVIYVSNMAMGDSGQKLVIYRMTDLDSEGIPTKAEVVMPGYAVPAGERFGDKMTSYGSDADGLLFFVSFYCPNQYRTNMEFKLTDGIVADEPIYSPYLGTAGGSTTASIHMFGAQTTGDNSTRQALYGSNFDFRYLVTWWWGTPDPDGWYQTKIEDGTAPKVYVADDQGDAVYGSFAGMGKYDANANDPILFFLGSERYIAYVTVEQNSQQRSSGYLRLIHVPLVDISADYPVQAAMYKIRDNDACFQRYALGDPDDFYAVGWEGTNKTGFCDVLQDGGETYILAGVTSTGMSLFKVD